MLHKGRAHWHVICAAFREARLYVNHAKEFLLPFVLANEDYVNFVGLQPLTNIYTLHDGLLRRGIGNNKIYSVPL